MAREEEQEKFTWVTDNLDLGDHVGVQTAGFLFWGKYLSYKVAHGRVTLALELDSGEVITLRLADVLDINGAWPQ